MKHAASLPALAAAAVLSVAACGGGGGAPSTPAASQTPSASPIPTHHTAQPGEPALLTVPGYDYTDLPSGDVASVKAMVKSNPQQVKSGSGHAVLRDGNKIADMLLFQMQPQFANSLGGQQQVVDKMVEGAAGGGATVSQETIHTEKVAIVRKDSAIMYAWYHASTLTIVAGDNASAVRGFAEAYLKTAHASNA